MREKSVCRSCKLVSLQSYQLHKTTMETMACSFEASSSCEGSSCVCQYTCRPTRYVGLREWNCHANYFETTPMSSNSAQDYDKPLLILEIRFCIIGTSTCTNMLALGFETQTSRDRGFATPPGCLSPHTSNGEFMLST